MRGGNNSCRAAPNNTYSTTYSATNNAPVVLEAGASNVLAAEGDFVLESANIYWGSADALDVIFAFGWTDNF